MQPVSGWHLGAPPFPKQGSFDVAGCGADKRGYASVIRYGKQLLGLIDR